MQYPGEVVVDSLAKGYCPNIDSSRCTFRDAIRLTSPPNRNKIFTKSEFGRGLGSPDYPVPTQNLARSRNSSDCAGTFVALEATLNIPPHSQDLAATDRRATYVFLALKSGTCVSTRTGCKNSFFESNLGLEKFGLEKVGLDFCAIDINLGAFGIALGFMDGYGLAKTCFS